MKLKIIKNTRTVEIPNSATREELICIISKWAYLIANDSDKSPYQINETGIKPIDSNKKTDSGLFESFNNIFNGSNFSDIFNGKQS